MEKNNTMVAYIAIGILVLGLAGFAGYSFMSGNTAESNTDTAQEETMMDSGESMEEPAGDAMMAEEERMEAGDEEAMMEDESGAEYTDGEYSAVGSYTSPAGPETVQVDVTLEDGVITDVAFDGQAENDTSIKFQTQFAENYQEMVVGKTINEVELDKVAGSSLTAGGFNDALEQIKEQAQG